MRIITVINNGRYDSELDYKIAFQSSDRIKYIEAKFEPRNSRAVMFE